MEKILIIEDDISLRNILENFLHKNKFEVITTDRGKAGLEIVTSQDIDFVLLDLRLPDSNGIEILQAIKKVHAHIPIVIMTFYDDVRSAVMAIKSGARDYLTKPINPEELLSLLKPAAILNKNTEICKEEFVKGKSHLFESVLEHASLVAPTMLSVLITGESGTGKEELAKYIHSNSLRKHKSFVTVDCGSISEELFGSEFFGHIKGAFTGAINDKPGLLESANGGTLFLDELGNLTYENQIKLLRVLQERKVKRIGATKEIELDIRLIAATNEEIILSVQKEKFREDLYHRLNEFKIHVPALRDRKEDLKELTQHFISKSNTEFNKHVKQFSDTCFRVLAHYAFPGNIRELKNVVRRAVLLAKSDVIGTEELPQEMFQAQSVSADTVDLKSLQEQQEKDTIIKALKKTGNNKSEAARILNIDRKTLYNKLKLYQLE
ncbi:sigma-54-dependent transcriptional regulator [Cytophaga aurantiaca]|uniref:sigma-54-dependent transcriptional regulator n=1 Tax=Cytophaga aurantiaca TaxID=29530 RepID=UPI00037E4B02|nr:sigma-54 dependent transcriptional regulator [Cytophaga aurantiaca]